MDKEERQKMIHEVAEHLPKEFVNRMMVALIDHAIGSVSWESREIVDLLKTAVIERSRELLKTKYKEEIEKKAELLAAHTVGLLPQLEIKSDRRY